MIRRPTACSASAETVQHRMSESQYIFAALGHPQLVSLANCCVDKEHSASLQKLGTCQKSDEWAKNSLAAARH